MIIYNFKLSLQDAKTVYTNAVLTTDDVSAYRLCFTFLNNGIPYDVKGCALVIKAKRADNQVVTDSGVVTGTGDVYYDMKSSVYAVEGELSVEVALCTPQGGYITTHELIFKVRQGHGEAALTAENMTPIISGLIGRAFAGEQKAEMAQAIGQNALDATERLDAQMRQNFSNALKGCATGTLVCAKDVSPIEHELKVVVRKKNLFKPSILNQDVDHSLDISEDNKITLTKTAETGGVVFAKVGCLTLHRGKTYAISIHNAVNVLRFGVLEKGTMNDVPMSNGVIAPTETMDVDIAVYMSDISAIGNTCECYVQVEEGASATKYTPYVEDLESVIVKKHGKNLLEHRFTKGVTETINGITISGNDDGSITLNGKAESDTEIPLTSSGFMLPGSTYTFSGFSELNASARWYYLSYTASKPGFDGLIIGGVLYQPDTFEVEGELTDFKLCINEGVSFNNEIFKLQLEFDIVPTEYVPPRVSEIYQPDSNGVVKGLLCSEFVNLTTDNANVMLNVEYNKDISKPYKTELIETIEVTEEGIRSIVRTQTPDGVPYNFKAMYVRYEVSPCSVKNLVQIKFYDALDKLLCYYQLANAVGSNGFISVHADVIGGMWQAIATATVVQGSPTGVSMWGRNLVPYGGEKIAKVEVYGYDTSFEVIDEYPVNIKIYGVRA